MLSLFLYRFVFPLGFLFRWSGFDSSYSCCSFRSGFRISTFPPFHRSDFSPFHTPVASRHLQKRLHAEAMALIAELSQKAKSCDNSGKFSTLNEVRQFSVPWKSSDLVLNVADRKFHVHRAVLIGRLEKPETGIWNRNRNGNRNRNRNRKRQRNRNSNVKGNRYKNRDIIYFKLF